MPNKEQKLQTIGVIKTGGMLVDVVYLGGSTFSLVFPENAPKNPPKMDKSKVDDLIASNMLKLTSEDVYRRICDNIDPVTGETAEHHADGTPKTEVEKTLHMLNQSRSAKADRGEAEATEPEHGRQVLPYDESLGNEVPGAADPTTAHSMTRRRPNPSQQAPQQPQGPQVSQADLFGDDAPTPSQPDAGAGFGTGPQVGERPGGFGGDDGFGRDESDDRDREKAKRPSSEGSGTLKMSPATRRTKVAATAVIGLLGCVLFFMLPSTLIRHLGIRLSDIPVIGQTLSGDDRRDLPASEQVPAGEKEFATQTTSGLEVVVRSDFDPETPVIQLAIADEQSQDIALKVFQQIRVFYSQGNLDQLNNMIAYNYIHGQMADAYAALEQQRLNLTDDARTALSAQYLAVLNKREGLHIAQHDMDASIYCGRIREVRVDDEDPLRLYVVMESLAGDHQRICFILQGSLDGMYGVIGITDPVGYVTMIREGTI